MSAAEKGFARKVPAGRAELWKGGRPLLARLDIELTERCNNDCLHCSVNLPAGDGEARRRESTTAEVKHVLAEAAALGCLSVRFTGGEPLLREDFEELYVTARKLGLRVRIFTNAMLITPGLAALFKKIPPLDKMEVSVYGMTAATSAGVTGNKASFEAARRGIALLLSRGVPFVVKGAVLPPTKDEMDRFEAWTREIPGMTGSPSYAMLFDLRSRRDMEAKNERIRSLRLDPAEYVRMESRLGDGRAAELRAFVARFGGCAGDRLFGCLSDAGSVDAYGRFQVCLLLRHPDTVYDLEAGSLRAAMEEFLPRVRDIRATNPAYLERCGRCFLKSLCLQCPARSWAEHGTLDTPVEYFCGIAHAQAEWIGILAPGEKAWKISDGRRRIERPILRRRSGPEALTNGFAECKGEKTWKAR
jgi:radical SAM protein with 4Fe4S-binding SPASM domain